MKWPKLPKTIHAPAGPVTVVLQDVVKNEKGEELWGVWEGEDRTIRIDESASLRYQWHTFFHELMHVALCDSGIAHLLPDESQEALCDAVATARLAEMVGTLSRRSRK